MITEDLLPEIVVNITGFGSFPGVDKNPTETIVSFIHSNQNELNFLSSPQYKVKELNVNVLDVSVPAVCKYFEQQEHSLKDDRIRVSFHLGVDSSSTTIKLESKAWNNMTFRVPDTSGYEPMNECIDASIPFDCPLETNVTLNALDSLASHDHVKVSTNPGRYLCNYIFFRSLQYVKDRENVYSLFIHVPPFHVIPLEVQTRLLDEIFGNLLIDIAQKISCFNSSKS